MVNRQVPVYNKTCFATFIVLYAYGIRHVVLYMCFTIIVVVICVFLHNAQHFKVVNTGVTCTSLTVWINSIAS